MPDIAHEAELEKLARLLQVERAALDFLDDQPVEDLRRIREGLTDALFEKFRPTFTGFARMASVLPLGIAARISHSVLGPVLSGRIAGEMPPERAVDMAERLSDDFLADVCVEMEPSRARPIIQSFPIERSVAITRRLLERGEYITMGQFVDVLPRATLLAAADAIESPLALLRIAFFVESREQLACVIAHLSHARRAEVIHAAAEHELWPEVIDTLERIDEHTRAELAAQALTEHDAVLDSLIRAAAVHDLWPQLLAIGTTIDDDSQSRFAGQPAFCEEQIICSIVDSVDSHALWPLLEQYLAGMGTPRAARMLAVCADQRPNTLADMAKRFELTAATTAVLGEASETLEASQRDAATQAAGPDTALGQLIQR